MRILVYHIWLSILLLLVSLSACETFTDWPLEPDGDSRLVVEAILVDRTIRQEILLSQSFASINDSAPGVTDAQVSVEANGRVYDFVADPREAGRYLSAERFKVQRNLLYTLSVEWQGTAYTASSELSRVGPIPTVRFIQHPQRDSLRISEFVDIFHPNQQAMYEIDIDWRHIYNDSTARARLYYYTFSSVHISELIRPDRERIWFPPGSIVVVKKFGLNDDFADYLRSMAIETDWNGIFYYTDSGNLPSNLSNDAYGFFSTCAVLVDTLIAE